MVFYLNVSMRLINLDILITTGWSSDFRLATVLERIWQLLKEPNMAQIHPDAITVFNVYRDEREVFINTTRLWTAEMMKE